MNPNNHTYEPTMVSEQNVTMRTQLILSNSTSNLSVEFGGMTGGKPRAPYA